MSKGSRRRPFDREKWSRGWDRAFGMVSCRRCGRSVRRYEAKPLVGGRGETGVLCPNCRKEATHA